CVYSPASHGALAAFPTRRSSDLDGAGHGGFERGGRLPARGAVEAAVQAQLAVLAGQTDPHRVLRAVVRQREAAAVDGDGTRMQGELELLLAEPCPGPLRGAGQRDLVRGLLVPVEAHHERGGLTEAPAGGAVPEVVGAGAGDLVPVHEGG